jgi:beta-lactam-binding protein with PASTA domain
MNHMKTKSWLPILLGIVFVFFITQEVFSQTLSQQKTMPNVIGMTYQQADAFLRQAGLPLAKTTMWETNDPNQHQKVFSQKPEPGKPVVGPVTLEFYQLKGAVQQEVPRLTNMLETQARQDLERMGFKVQIVANTTTDRQDMVGRVASQSDIGKLPKGANVILYTYKLEVNQVSLPNVVGLKLDQARQVLTQAGLQMQGKFEPSARQEDDNKVSGISNPLNGQSLSAGQKMPKNSLVHLSILQYQPSQKPSQTGGETKPSVQQPQTQTGQAQTQVTMPKLEGATESEARERLNSVGIKSVKINPPTPTDDRNKDGKILNQWPVAGNQVPMNSEVTVNIYKYQAPQTKEMPNLMGASHGTAINLLLKLGFYPAVITQVSSYTKDRDQDLKVFSQEPPAGKQISTNTQIKLSYYVYSAPKIAVMPNLVGLEKVQAVMGLMKAGLQDTNKNVIFQTIPTQDRNLDKKVITQEPSSGQPLSPDTKVTLKVYEYQISSLVEVPNVVGLTVQQASDRLRGAWLGLKKDTTLRITDQRQQDDTVAAQDPAAGQKVKPASTVNLKIYKYVDPSQRPVEVAVPLVVNKTLDEARRLLEERDFQVEVMSVPVPTQKSEQNGLVAKQSPTGIQKRGTKVTLNVFKLVKLPGQ